MAFARPEHMVAYAKAVNDENPVYVDESRDGGIVAHPLFPVRQFNETLYKVAMDSDLELDLVRLVHGEQDMRYYQPIKSFSLLNVRGQLHDIVEKDSGTLVTTRIYAYEDGRLAAEAYSGLFIRGRGKKKEGEAKVPEAPAARGELVLNASFKVADDQAKRYSAISLDTNPIHLDESAARAAGLPGCILHGLCTMAMSSTHIVNTLAGGDPGRLKRLAVRFSKPVFMGDELRVEAWKSGEAEGETHYAFEVINQNGQAVITHGVAEIKG
jgi:acyl dehydratase